MEKVKLFLSKEHIELAILILEQAKNRRKKRIALLNEIVDARKSNTNVGMISLSIGSDTKIESEFKEEISKKTEMISNIESLLNEFLKTGVN